MFEKKKSFQDLRIQAADERLIINAWSNNHRIAPEFKENKPLQVRETLSKPGPITGGLLLIEEEGLILHDDKNSVRVLEKESFQVIAKESELKGYVTSMSYYKNEKMNAKWIVACTAGYGKNMIYIWTLPDKSEEVPAMTRVAKLGMPDYTSDMIILEPRGKKDCLELITKTASSIVHLWHFEIKSSKQIGRYRLYPFFFNEDNVRVITKLFNKNLAIALGARKNMIYVLKICEAAPPKNRIKHLRSFQDEDALSIRSIVPSKFFHNIIFTSGSNQHIIIINFFNGQKLARFPLDDTPSIFGLTLAVFEWGEKTQTLRSMSQLNCLFIHAENSTKSRIYSCRVTNGKGEISLLWEDPREILETPKVYYNPMQIQIDKKNHERTVSLYFSSGPYDFKETYLEEDLKIFQLKLN